MTIAMLDSDWSFIPLFHLTQPIAEEGDKTLLHLALEHRNSDFAEILVGAGARTDLYNDDLDLSPIHVVATSGVSLNHLIALLENRHNKADVNAVILPTGQTALHLVAKNGKLDFLERLLQEPKVRKHQVLMRLIFRLNGYIA